ncbi:MAG: hypothetical protein K0S27_1276 [Gammaproteobacteria bacterium]|jgi:hypothetical protein|nr:hypothetical protein [Gammaproteobacteria bacterium]
MTKRYLNIGGIIGVFLALIIVEVLLLQNKILLLSIDAMQSFINQWVIHWHVIAVGLLPIYVSVIFFGALIAGLFLGSIMQRWVMWFCNKM